MSSSSIHIDSKSMLIDSLKVDRENFLLSNLILPSKRALTAISKMYGLQDDLLKFAHDANPKKEPYLPPMPQEPDLDGLSEEQAANKMEQYENLKRLWDVMHEAHELKVPIGDYMHIMNYIDKFKRTLHASAALKGKRFFAFTKNVADEKKGGGLASLFGGDKE